MRKGVVAGVTEPGQRSLFDAALGRGGREARQEIRRPVQVQGQGVSIMGAARGTTWVKVEHLASGTTAEDVVVRRIPSSQGGH